MNATKSAVSCKKLLNVHIWILMFVMIGSVVH